MNLKQQISQTLYNKAGRLNSSFLKTKKFKVGRLYKLILEKTNFLPEQMGISERVYCITNDINLRPTCHNCGRETKWDPATHQFRQFCSVTCGAVNTDVRQKQKQTLLKNYGVSSPFESRLTRQKSNDTVKQRYNVGNVSQLETVKQRKKQQSIDRYGTSCPLHSGQVKSKVFSTWQNKYNVSHPQKSKVVRQKTEQTNLKRYGGLAPACSDTVRDKITATVFAKYGVSSTNYIHFSNYALKYITDKQWLIQQHHIEKKFQVEIAKELNVSPTTLGRHLKKSNVLALSFKCSYQQRQLSRFIQEHYKGIVLDNVKIPNTKQEIDILIPDMNLAFEYNGIFWHSQLQGKDKKYHLQKTMLCAQNNIRLVHILESEWEDKKEIVKSRIRSILGSNETIYARLCSVKPISLKQKEMFFQNTHIQGDVLSSINFALYYQGIVVAAMSFGVPKFTDTFQYELLRYSTILNINVVGGPSKLFQTFIKQYRPVSVVTYSDRRWNIGRMYKNLGFSFVTNTRPNYFYFKPGKQRILYSRITFQKHKLKDKLPFFNPQLTEWENMVNNGYDRIWDCGNDVWVWTS